MENDLADRLDDLICAFDSGFDSASNNLESIIFLLLGWVVLAFIVYVIVYRLFKTNQPIRDDQVSADEPDLKKEELPEKEEVIKKDERAKEKTPVKDVPSIPLPVLKVKPKTAVEKDATAPSSSTTATTPSTTTLQLAPDPPPTKASASTSLTNGSSHVTNGVSHVTNGHTEKLSIEVPRSLGSDEEAVAWVNSCLKKAFAEESISQELVKLWINSLTQYTKSSGAEDGVAVEFTDIDKMPNYPKISNVITQTHPGDNMTITADLVMTSLSLKGNLIQYFSDDSEESHEITLALDQMRGRINLSVLSRERWLIVRFDGWPEVKARLIPEPKERDRKSKDQMFKTICDVARDLSVAAVRGAQVNINMEEFVDPNDDVTTVFPAFVRGQKRSNSLCPSMGADQPLKLRPPPPAVPTIVKTPILTPKTEKPAFTHELSIRVVKAMQLGMTSPSPSGATSLRPYVIVEIDEPGQRGRTDPVDLQDDPTGTPHWNQEFNFNLTERSGEVLFEVWDSVEADGDANNVHTSPSPRDGFLGLGIVSIDELMITSSQRLVLPLQGRPYYSDNDGDVVNGLLMVQFDMVDMLRRKKAQKKFQRKRSDRRSFGQDSMPASETMDGNPMGPDASLPGENEIMSFEETSLHSSTESDMERSRRRTKRPKRTLVSTLKKRLSTYTPATATRSASVHLQTDFERENNSKGVWKSISKFFAGPRSVSADRLAKPFTSNTVAGAKSFLAVPHRGSDDGSSMSDMSGITSASAKTYIAEESSLVIETMEKGMTKHYMIPFNIAEKGHLRTKGTKLHIYMDHIFVAKRVKGGTLCEVCVRKLPLSLGKQGYVCRDCALTCHKPCHIKVEGHCEHTSLPAMELQLYEESYASK